MKKILFFTALTAAVFSSCSNDENLAVPVTADNAGNAISFNAYTSTALATRGEVRTPDMLKGADKGIGVFAFYQADNELFNTHKFATPDFMYNQRVYTTADVPTKDVNKSSTAWTYTPTKYWPNNTGDHVSFFAYAPYDGTKQWADLGITTDQNNTKMNVNFPIYNDAKDQVDYLWADPQINMSNASTAKTDSFKIDQAVPFNFKHVTSQVSLYVGVDQNVARSSSTTAPTDATPWVAGTQKADKTEIVVNSIEFTNLDDNIAYEYPISSTGAMTTPANVKPCSTQQNITLSDDNFNATAATINVTNYPDTTAGTTPKQYADMIKAGIQPYISGSSYFKQLTKDDNYMFLAPKSPISSTDKTKVTITYTVTTTDEDNAANSSTIVNKITKNLSDLVSSLEAGHAYRFFFLIGMNQVNITASETAWADATNHQVDVPANK